MATIQVAGKSEKNQKQPKADIATADLAGVTIEQSVAQVGTVRAAVDGTLNSQAAVLSNSSLLTAQRQTLAAKIGQVQGNGHLQRVMANLQSTGNNPTKGGRLPQSSRVAQRQEGGPEAEPEASTGAEAQTLVVEDEAEEIRPGQMRKTEFLDQLEAAVCETAEHALAGTSWSAMGCPTLNQWFAYYRRMDSTHIQRAIHRYVPDSSSAIAADDYIPAICGQVEQSVSTWVETGEMTGVPEDIGNVEAAIGAGMPGEEQPEPAQLKAQVGSVPGDQPEVIHSELGPGAPVEGGVRTRMERAFETDFSQVRVHSDGKSANMAQGLSARAFTVGEHIAFGAGEYQPGSPIGDALIAHELAHVVQQEGSEANRTLQKGGTEYDSLENDADNAAVGAVVSLWSQIRRGFSSVPQRMISPEALPRLKSGLRLSRCGSSDEAAEQAAERKAAERKYYNGYTTFLVSVPGDQKFIVQFYRSPGETEGAMLRFKADGDSRPPSETPIPAGATFNPTIVQDTNDLATFSFAGNNQVNLSIHLAAGVHTERHDAINPERPYGPLRMDQEFRRNHVEALISHPNGSEKYSWKGSLPDEAVSPPTWQMYVHGGRLPGYRAVSGKYQGRALLFGTDIKEGERAAVRGFEAGSIAAVKFFGSLVVYSIPYVGPLVLIGEALAGKTIWGDKLSTEARVAFGLLALIPIARAARSATAESTAAAELAARHGITRAEALTLIRGAKAFTAEERAYIESATTKVKAGEALTEAEATRLANLLNKIGTQEQLIFSGANDIEMIWTSRRYWGQTEGSVYGARLPVTTFWQRLKAMIGTKEGMVVFQGNAAKLFHAHEVEGGYSAMKRLLGQHKSGFGDIIFDQAVKEGNTIIVTDAHIATAAEVQHAGQSTSWALARLWGRRLGIEPMATAAIPSAGAMVYMLYEWLAN